MWRISIHRDLISIHRDFDSIFVPEKKIVSLKKTLKKFFVSGTQCGGFQSIVILTP